MIVVDSSAWIEYVVDGPNASRFAEFVFPSSGSAENRPFRTQNLALAHTQGSGVSRTLNACTLGCPRYLRRGQSFSRFL